MWWSKAKVEEKPVDPLTLGYCDRCLKTFTEDESMLDCTIEVVRDGVKITASPAALCRNCAKEVFFGA